MLKTITRLFIALITVTSLAIVVLYSYNNNRTYFNNDTATGNTAGNIYNGGLFSENNGLIYFSNEKAGGSLYVMNSDLSNIRKLHDDKAVYINVDNNYIYYVRAMNIQDDNKGIMPFSNAGVFRIKLNGSELKSITGKPSAYLRLKGNDLYFQRYDVDTGINLYKYQIDGSNERILVNDGVIPVYITDTELYFTGFSNDYNINKVNLKSFLKYDAYDGSYYCPIFMDDYIYYIYANNRKIYRMNMDGSNKELLVDYPCRTYNITNSGTYLYYQVDDGKNDGIYRMHLRKMTSTLLSEGSYKQINVTNSYVFFKDYDNSNTYMVKADGVPDVNVFDPEALILSSSSDSNAKSRSKKR